METQQELGHDPAGTALKMCETAARSAPWEVGTRATVPRPAWISSQDTASAPALLVLDLDPPLLSPRFLTYGSNQHEGLAELLSLPRPSGCSAEAEGCVGLSVPVVPARTASPGGVMDPKSWAGSSTGTAPLAALVWLTPELMEPIHGAGTLLPHPGTSLRHGPPQMFFSHHIKDIKL